MWKGWLAAAWLAGFSLLFYGFDLPNFGQPAIRWDVWLFIFLNGIPVSADPHGIPSGWQFFPQRLDLIATAALVLAGAGSMGRLTLRAVAPPQLPPGLFRFVLTMGIGLSATSLLTLALGLLGGLSRVPFLVAIALSALAETTLTLRGRAHSPPANPLSLPRRSATKFALVCTLAAAPFLLAMLLGSLLPPTDFDVREYHLQGPKEFYQNGRISFLPHNVYTSFPFLTEMLSLQAMAIRGDWYRGALAGQCVLMCFGPLTALALLAAGKHWFSPAAGWLAAFVHLTTPWTFRISIIAYAEGGLSFYLLIALMAAWRTIDEFRTIAATQPPPALPWRWTMLAGLLAGSAMACKYTGLVSVVFPLGLASCVAALRIHRNPRTAIKVACAFGLGAGLAVGPWLLKNLVETGNPVYPLAYTLFGGADWDAELNAKWKAAHSSPHYNDLGQRVVEVSLRNDWLSPLLYGFAPLALLVVLRRRTVLWLWLFVGWLFISWWLFTHRLDRFWVPMLPVVALLAGCAVSLFRDAASRSAAVTLCAAAVVFNLWMVTSGKSGMNLFLADLPALQESTEARFSSEMHWLNHALTDADRILLVGEAEVFDARRPVVYNTVFDHSIFEQWTGRFDRTYSSAARPLADAAKIRQRFQQQGVTHVLVNWQEILRYRITYGYTDYVTPARFETLQNLGILGPPDQFANNTASSQRAEQPLPLQQLAPSQFADFTRLSQREQDELRRFAPQLIIKHAAGAAYKTWQVFPVLQ